MASSVFVTAGGGSGFYAPDGSASRPSYSFANDTDTGWYSGAANNWYFSSGGTNAARLSASQFYLLSATASLRLGEVLLHYGGSAGILEQRNTTAAQIFRIYNTTDGTNSEFCGVGFGIEAANTLSLVTSNAGTGTVRPMVIGTRGSSAAVTFKTNNVNRWQIGGASGHLLGQGAVKFGWAAGAGAGGAVTQLTNKGTGVTSNTPTTEITMNNAALAAAAIIPFTFTNSVIEAGDHVLVTHVSGGTLGAYGFASTAAAGSATIYVRNNTAGSLSEAIVLKVSVVGSVTT